MMGIKSTILLLLIATGAIGQTFIKDSLIAKNEELRKEIKSIQKLLSGCTCSETDNPKWTNKKLKPITYYKGCQWKGTYFVFNNDSTFLYVSWVEPQQYFLQKGKWQMLNDSTYNLTGNYNLSLQFKKEMKKFDRTKYTVKQPFAIEFTVEEEMKKKMIHR